MLSWRPANGVGVCPEGGAPTIGRFVAVDTGNVEAYSEDWKERIRLQQRGMTTGGDRLIGRVGLSPKDQVPPQTHRGFRKGDWGIRESHAAQTAFPRKFQVAIRVKNTSSNRLLCSLSDKGSSALRASVLSAQPGCLSSRIPTPLGCWRLPRGMSSHPSE